MMTDHWSDYTELRNGHTIQQYELTHYIPCLHLMTVLMGPIKFSSKEIYMVLY